MKRVLLLKKVMLFTFRTKNKAKYPKQLKNYILYGALIKNLMCLTKKITEEFTSWTSITALFFKNEFFSTEEEYRFVAIAPVAKLKSLHYEYEEKQYNMYDFRLVNDILTPYIKMPFNSWNKEECWAVSSIGIGPSVNSIQMENGLKQFLKSFDYEMRSCRIYHSQIPLRY